MNCAQDNQTLIKHKDGHSECINLFEFTHHLELPQENLTDDVT